MAPRLADFACHWSRRGLRGSCGRCQVLSPTCLLGLCLSSARSASKRYKRSHRRREGIGLGDAKLMALLGAWLGLSGALLSFAVGVLLGAIFALVVLAVPA